MRALEYDWKAFFWWYKNFLMVGKSATTYNAGPFGQVTVVYNPALDGERSEIPICRVKLRRHERV